MKLVLEISENKVDFILNLLRKYSFVKVKAAKKPKEELIKDIHTAVEEMQLIKQGKLKARPVAELLDDDQSESICPEQLNLLERRLEEYHANPSIALIWDEAKSRISSSRASNL